MFFFNFLFGILKSDEIIFKPVFGPSVGKVPNKLWVCLLGVHEFKRSSYTAATKKAAFAQNCFQTILETLRDGI